VEGLRIMKSIFVLESLSENPDTGDNELTAYFVFFTLEDAIKNLRNAYYPRIVQHFEDGTEREVQTWE
jgi:hypothetical protein